MPSVPFAETALPTALFFLFSDLAFRPVCCLPFLAENTFSEHKKHFWHVFNYTFRGAFFTIKLGKDEIIGQNVQAASRSNAMFSLGNKRASKGGFGERTPSYRFSVRGNMRTYPRSGFRSGGTSKMYPRSGGNIRQNHPFGKPPFCQPQRFRYSLLAFQILEGPTCRPEIITF